MREPERIIRLRTVLSRTGLSRSTIYRKIAEGTFPPQIRISVNGSGWHESDINRWIADPDRKSRCGRAREFFASSYCGVEPAEKRIGQIPRSRPLPRSMP